MKLIGRILTASVAGGALLTLGLACSAVSSPDEADPKEDPDEGSPQANVVSAPEAVKILSADGLRIFGPDLDHA